jgi:hypothetical protein
MRATRSEVCASTHLPSAERKAHPFGLRHLILVAPILACLLHPVAGPIAAVLVVVVLGRFDRIAANGSPKDN